MGVFSRQPQVNLEKLEAEITGGLADPHDDIEDFAAPRAGERNTRPVQEKPRVTWLQFIAYHVGHLTWQEAEAMGLAIESMEGNSLTAKIQAWAQGWRGFNEKSSSPINTKDRDEGPETSADRSQAQGVHYERTRPRSRPLGAVVVSPEQNGGSRDSQA